MNGRKYAPPGRISRANDCSCGGARAGTDNDRNGYGNQLKTRANASSAPPGVVHEVLKTLGQPLDPLTRAFMESRFNHSLGEASGHPIAASPSSQTLVMGQPGDRFEQEANRMTEFVMRSPDAQTGGGYDFSRVRVHTDTDAAESARAVNALAYTVGAHIVFGAAQYAPGTLTGRRLLAHELVHVVQQSGQHSGPLNRLMRKWEDAPDCATRPKDKWIKTVTVNQEGSQTVTVDWSDSSAESDQCSAGKGHCCVDASNPTGVACTLEGSHKNGSNCTPITRANGFLVKNRVLDHSGVKFWTEFVPERAIALHEYSPIDGTPLSHGCVRLHTDMAKKIFCGVRQEQTWVKVLGFARPKCDNANLQAEWLADFSTAGTAKPDGITTAAEIAESRSELNAAFGRTLTVAEINKFTAADIPRCKGKAPLPKITPATVANPQEEGSARPQD